MLSQFDSVIVGQGLSGTTLAWSLLRLGQKVLIIDPGLENSASRIAAGLITPITGRKFTLSWRYELFFSEAERFYAEIEQETGSSFFHKLPHWHLFSSPEQRELFAQRFRNSPELKCYASPVQESLPEPISCWLKTPFGAYQMKQSAQLKTEIFLSVSLKLWQNQGIFLQETLDPAEIVMTDRGIEIPRLQIQSRFLIFCRGAEDRFNPWFSQLQLLPAKGEILTLDSPVPLQEVIHAGIWLAPGRENEWKVGSTYEWQQLDQESTPAAREEIFKRLSQLGEIPFHIKQQQAAIRPALHDQRPVTGRHPRFPGLAILNGLGSKGSLQAPWLARQLAEHLCLEKPLDHQIDLNSKFPESQTRTVETEC